MSVTSNNCAVRVILIQLKLIFDYFSSGSNKCKNGDHRLRNGTKGVVDYTVIAKIVLQYNALLFSTKLFIPINSDDLYAIGS
jgi:hypothetical protein